MNVFKVPCIKIWFTIFVFVKAQDTAHKCIDATEYL